ncbi:tetratricopeptide repeat protein [Phormidium sp. FACHB-1136]|uniref:tetratricopeptide repeat protein n=1 Tax=Phormidium sp. FACHB-1136 TaxID=2692848 RepID=UPI00168297E5|nr:tetratricopeptide repeat protein [Phormidium sp. FACHB-1136]MBD2428168.1 tetratricopeptide repeat protein [Phormidium sp. FACHB-1136]
MQKGRASRLVSLALLAALLVGQSPSAWSQPLASADATRVAQSVPGFEPLTITGALDENSTVEAGRSFNVHTFEGVAGQIVVIDLSSNEFDALLGVRAPNGEVIATDNDSGDGTNARLLLSLPDTGTYWIGAFSLNPGEKGLYQLTVQSGMADWEQMERLSEANRLNTQGLELVNTGRYGEAEPAFQESLKIRREQLGDHHPDVATSLSNLASSYHLQGRYGEAEPLFQESLTIFHEQLGDRHPTVATSLNNLASLYRDQGRYGEAKPLHQEALSIRREQLGDRHPDVASSLSNLARLYQDEGRYEEAELFFQEALSIFREQLDDRHPTVATSVNNLAELYREQGRYGEAEPLHQEALSIRRERLGNRHPDVAQSLSNLALLYSEQGRYVEAEPLYQEALSIRREQLGDRHPSVAQSLNSLAALYFLKGRYGEAAPLFQESLSIGRERLGSRHPDVAQSLSNLALLYTEQGFYVEAEPLYQEALSIRRERMGERHPDVATSLNNLASLYRDQGRYREAETLFQEVLSIFREQLGDHHPNIATSLNNLASSYRDQGRYGDAEPLLQEALSIFRKQLGDSHPAVATSLNNLALLYRSLGRYGEAEPLYQEALSIRREQLGDRHPDIAISLNNLAELYQIQGRYVEAEVLLQEALSIVREQLGGHHPNVAASLHNLASVYQTQMRYGEAVSHSQEALNILRQQLGDRHPNVATNLNNLASSYRDQGRYGDAEPLFQEALNILREQLGDRHPDVAISLNNLAWLYWAQGEMSTALTWLQQGLSVEETNLSLNLAIGSDDRKRDYISTLSGTTNYVLSLHLQDAATNPTAARLALTTVLRRKGRVLDAVTDTQQLLRQNLSPDLAPLLDDYTAAQTQLAAQLYAGLGNQDPEVYRTRIDDLRQEVNRLENELSRRSAAFRVETEPVEIEAVQALIPADAALVELVQYRPFDPSGSGSWGQPRYAAYILHNSGDPKWVDLGEAETIDTAARAFLAATRNPNSGSQARATARALDELVMTPIRPLLGDATHLLLSPDSQLNLIPFAALVDEQNRYLVETYTLTHLTTGRDLLRLQNTAPSQQPPVLFANPNYDTANPSGTQLIAAASSNSPRPLGEGPGVRATDQRSTDITNLRFNPLPGTQQEVDAITPLLPNNAIILTEATATENALKQVQAPSILHIATHGFFLEDVEFVPPPSTRGDRATGFLEPTGLVAPPTRPVSNENPLLRSGLALAGFNIRTSAGEDGVLTALEATGLNLRGTRLVVLSACETGVGQVANGEGVYGLRRAFVMAGAESQLMSLWKVDDLGTAELMQRYYQRLQNGEGRSESLRQVQLEFMANPTYQHPYYWASFMFSGQWSPMTDR